MKVDQHTQFPYYGKSLAIIEPTAQADKVEMDPENLKFFISKLKVWDFAKISSSEFQVSSSEII